MSGLHCVKSTAASILLFGAFCPVTAWSADDAADEGDSNSFSIKLAPKPKADAASAGSKEDDGLPNEPEPRLGDTIKPKPIPKGCTADWIASKSDACPAWRPQWRYVGLGGPWLPSAAVSDDKSVLAVAETTGEKETAKGARIAILDTYSWKTLKTIDVPGSDIIRISFSPGGKRLYFLTKPQAEQRRPAEIGCVHLGSSTPTVVSRRINFDPVDICSTKEGVCALSPDGRVTKYKLSDLTTPAKPAKDAKDAGKQSESVDLKAKGFAAASNHKSGDIAVIVEGKLIIFKGGDFTSRTTVELNLQSGKPMLSPAGDAWMAMAPGGKGCIVRTGKSVGLVDLGGGAMLYDAKNAVIGFETIHRNTISLFDIVSLAPSSTIIPENLKPKTKSACMLLEALPHQDRYLALDTLGNLYLLAKTGKRWSKEMILTAVK